MTTEPGKCPRCNMDLVPGNPLTLPDFKLKVETTPRVLKAGQPIKFRFTVHHPITGEQTRDFAVMHDKLFHLFVISRDLNEFAHIHPERHADGSFTIEHTLPKPGHYTLFADFLPLGGGAQITGYPLATVGTDVDLTAARARLNPDAVLAQTADGVKVDILNERATILGGEEVDLLFRFTDAKTDAPITDLEKYLGAFGHLVILSEDMTEYVHAHPREESQPDPNAPRYRSRSVIGASLAALVNRMRRSTSSPPCIADGGFVISTFTPSAVLIHDASGVSFARADVMSVSIPAVTIGVAVTCAPPPSARKSENST